MKILQITQNRADAISALFIASFGLFLLFWAIDKQVRLVSGFGVDARLYPKVLAAALIFGALAILIQSYLESSASSAVRVEKSGLIRVIAAIATTFLLIASINYVGIYVASFVAVPMYMRILGANNYKVIAISSFSVPCIVYAIADLLLGLSLPGGFGT